MLTGELSAQKPLPVTYNKHDFIYLLALFKKMNTYSPSKTYIEQDCAK